MTLQTAETLQAPPFVVLPLYESFLRVRSFKPYRLSGLVGLRQFDRQGRNGVIDVVELLTHILR